MEKFIEEAMKKANAANLMTDEAATHIGELFDKAKIHTLEAWRKSVPEPIVDLFCALYNPMPQPIFNDFARLWEAFFAAGYWARNMEALEEMANDGEGQGAH